MSIRFNDNTEIETVSSADILPITDISDSTIDKKITVGQISSYTVENIESISGGKVLSDNNLSDIMKTQYDTSYVNNHTHSNKALLDNVISSGDGTEFLSDNGTYINLDEKINPLNVTLTSGTSNTLTEGAMHLLSNGSSSTSISMFTSSDVSKTQTAFILFTTSKTSQPTISGATFDYTPTWNTSKHNLITIFTVNGSTYFANHRVLGA